MYIVRVQTIQTILDETDHRFKTVASRIIVRTAKTEPEATTLVYETFLENSGIDSLYATVSVNGRFVRPIKFGTLDGFKQPGEVKRA